MTYVSRKWWLTVLLAFAMGGAAIGLGLPGMKKFAAAQFGRAGLAVFFVINIAMPLLIVSLSALHPRYVVAVCGTMLATLLFLACTGLRPSGLGANALTATIRSMGSILVVACFMYLVLAVGTVAVANLRWRVGIPPDPLACVKCGYKLIGLPAARCPECFEPFPSKMLASLQTKEGNA
jgi:hypothetical protein